MSGIWLVSAGIAGLALGLVVAWYVRRTGQFEIVRLRTERDRARADGETARRDLAVAEEQAEGRARQLQEQRDLLETSRQQLTDAFRATGAETLQANSQHFLELAKKTFDAATAEARGDVEQRKQAVEQMVKPLRELLEKQSSSLIELDKQRAADRSGIEAQLKSIANAHDRLGSQTQQLVNALKRPEQRGRWGEMQLRNVVEMAGMTRHCDFDEQRTVTGDEGGTLRPDMVVKLPGEGVIVVDSKVALDAYLEALERPDGRDALMQRHARQVGEHVRQLSSKGYWKNFERTPQLVVMFVPVEAALVAALEVNPDLLNDAMKNDVLIATPMLLVALLRAIAYGWKQEDVAENARAISKVGHDLYGRLKTFVDNFEAVGASLTKAANNYNKAVGSLERRVLPAARDLKELHATTAAPIDPPTVLEPDVRPIVAAELKDAPQVEGAKSIEAALSSRDQSL